MLSLRWLTGGCRGWLAMAVRELQQKPFLTPWRGGSSESGTAPGKGILAYLIMPVAAHIFITIRSNDIIAGTIASNIQSNDVAEWALSSNIIEV